MSDTTCEPISIGTAADLYSFLIPCWGFGYSPDGVSYAGSDDYLSDHHLDRDDTYRTFHIGRGGLADREYVPLVGTHDHEFNTTSFLDRNSFLERGGKPAWRTLWGEVKQKPHGAYNTALLVEGPRSFYHYTASAGLPSKFRQRLMNADGECYAVWGREDGAEISNGISTGLLNRVHTTRYGRGVLVAARASFDYTGAVTHHRVGLVQIEFSIFDNDPNQIDRIKIILNRRNWISVGSKEEVFGRQWQQEINDQGLGWKLLIQRAQLGFERHCHLTAPKVEEWRTYFLEQRRQADADRATYIPAAQRWRDGPSFDREMRRLSWEEALNMVREAWQLQRVIEVHLSPRFDEHPMYPGSRGARVQRMLDQYQCSPERRAQLEEWISSYVAPADDMWNFVGD